MGMKTYRKWKRNLGRWWRSLVNPAYTAELEDLVRHTWVHSGFERCGYREMSTPQKRLLEKISKSPASGE